MLIKRVSRQRPLHCAALIVAVAAAAAAAAVGIALCAPAVSRAAGGSDQPRCFLLHAWDGQWKVSPDSRSIYVVENGVIFRLDLQQPIPLLQSPWAILNTRGTSDSICRPEDLRLVVSDRLGGEDTAIVSRMTALTAAEAAALPKNLRPKGS
jgi:hypothetical protein